MHWNYFIPLKTKTKHGFSTKFLHDNPRCIDLLIFIAMWLFKQIEPHKSFMVTEIYAEINSISRWEFRIQPANSSVRLQVRVKVAQSCTTLCNPKDYTVHGILQARILEWVAFPFSRESSQPRNQTQISPIEGTLFTIWATREGKGKRKTKNR